MSAKVKILDFNRRSMSAADAEKALAELLDEGYSLAGQSEGNGFVSYTLVKQEVNLDVMVTGRDGIPAHAMLEATYAQPHPVRH